MKIISSLDATKRTTYFNELKIFNKINNNNDCIVRFYDNFYLGTTDCCLIIEYYEVKLKVFL